MDRRDTSPPASEPNLGRDQELFRPEALENLVQGRQRQGELLRISPSWTRWTYWLLIAVFLVGALFLVFGTVGEYAGGPGVVRIEGRRELTAMMAGTVTAVEARTGDSVVAGQILARFYDAQEEADLERANREFELQLVTYLKNPSDGGARQSLIALRTQKEFAQERLEQRIVRAPEAGVIGDVHARAGQVVSAGEPLLTLVGPSPTASLVAMLPGHYRPLLKPGMPLRLELAGYKYAYEILTIDTIGSEVIGPQMARRYLGPELADTVDLPGPVVVVRAKIPALTFTTGERSYSFHDGMHGRVEVEVRSESLLVTLVPTLRTITQRDHG